MDTKLLRSSLATEIKNVPELTGMSIQPPPSMTTAISAYNRSIPGVKPTGLRAAVCQAVLACIKGSQSEIAVSELSGGHYVAEKETDGGTMIVHMAFQQIKCIQTEASLKLAGGGLKKLELIGQKSCPLDVSPFFAIYLYWMKTLTSSSDPRISAMASEMASDFNAFQEAYISNSLLTPDGTLSPELHGYMYRINDAIVSFTCHGNNAAPKYDVSQNITKITDVSTLTDGKVLCGKHNVLGEEKKSEKRIPKTLGEMKTYIKNVFKPVARMWNDEQKALICDGHSDDWHISDALFDIVNMYYSTKNSEHPMLNISYRGSTGVGKSEDLKVMSQLLNMPLYIVTCSSNTRTEDFLSKQVPNTTDELEATIPSADEITIFPVDAYEAITGVVKEDASPEDCIRALMKKGSDANSGFIITYAAYLMGLMGGGIVEIQEASRIKDASTLVGLNEFCRQKALIPLADGRVAERNPDAICVWTDNYGYDSCRRKEASVKRRFDADIIAADLTKEEILSRITHDFKPAEDFSVEVLPEMYECWEKTKDLAQKEDLDEEIPWTDLRNWVYLLNIQGSYRGFSSSTIKKTFREAISNKFIEDADSKATANIIVSGLETCFAKISSMLCGPDEDII